MSTWLWVYVHLQIDKINEGKIGYGNDLKHTLKQENSF